ncbi:unnamed protein product [Brachionus calyciflorus]|uniref:Uncharacterized protein n=1 Tax=Brachionus calyciflorus TaxID=104777 RepID=A0A813QVW7_9BILA|nr:unnamed protein product [Brachionus calyciflorus]
MASNTQGSEIRGCNAIVNQNDKKYVRIMLTAPGLKTKRSLSLKKEPINCKVLEMEYKKHSVRIKFVINQGLMNETVFLYETDEDNHFNGPIQEKKSYLQFADNGIDIYARKEYDWSM